MLFLWPKISKDFTWNVKSNPFQSMQSIITWKISFLPLYLHVIFPQSKSFPGIILNFVSCTYKTYPYPMRMVYKLSFSSLLEWLNIIQNDNLFFWSQYYSVLKCTHVYICTQYPSHPIILLYSIFLTALIII